MYICIGNWLHDMNGQNQRRKSNYSRITKNIWLTSTRYCSANLPGRCQPQGLPSERIVICMLWILWFQWILHEKLKFWPKSSDFIPQLNIVPTKHSEHIGFSTMDVFFQTIYWNAFLEYDNLFSSLSSLSLLLSFYLFQSNLITFVCCSIDNTSELVWAIAWCQTGDKPLHKPMVTHSIDVYWVTGLQMLMPLFRSYLCMKPEIISILSFLTVILVVKLLFIYTGVMIFTFVSCKQCVFAQNAPQLKYILIMETQMKWEYCHTWTIVLVIMLSHVNNRPIQDQSLELPCFRCPDVISSSTFICPMGDAVVI